MTYRGADCDARRACANARCRHSTTAPVSSNPGGAENEGSSSANLKTVLAPLFDPRAGTLAPRLHDRNGLNDCGPVSYGSCGVSASNRRSPSRRTNTKPYTGVASACQPSPVRRSIVAAIAPDRSAAGSRRWQSSTCQCRSQTTSYRGAGALLKVEKVQFDRQPSVESPRRRQRRPRR
jgi:hypothetical protein